MTTSRTDLDEYEIQQRIRLVKRDRSLPDKWRDIELDYLYDLLRWTQRQSH